MEGIIQEVPKLIGIIRNDKNLTGQISSKQVIKAGTIDLTKYIYEKDYNLLDNKPQIESVKLIGNRTFEELGLDAISADDLIEIVGGSNG